MARQFHGRLAREQLRQVLAGAAAATADRVAAPLGGITGDAQPGTDLEQVLDWLTRLHLLDGIPFNYLVPDAAMLPAESIRFFQVDNNWVEALLDGAYSIGFAGAAQGTSEAARAAVKTAVAARALAGTRRRALLARAARRGRPAAAAPGNPAPAPDGGSTPETLTGFLLRSAVVAGWPGLEVCAYADTAGEQPLQIVQMETPAPSLLLVLLAGVLQRVDLQEPAEAVHFGFDASGTRWQKQLRYANGNDAVTVGSYIPGAFVPVPLRGTGVPAVLLPAFLATSMSRLVWTDPPPSDTAFTAAQFALEMVEGVQRVSFCLQSS